MKRFLVALAGLLCGCMSEKDASDVVLFVTPSAAAARGGETVYYDIEARTIHDRIERVEIVSFDRDNSERLLFEAAPCTRSYSHRFFYDVPVAGSDELEIELSFRATDDRGNMRCVRLLLRADPNASLLPERSSITLYSPHSGKVDGLSFATCQPLLCATSLPEEVDLYVAADEQADPELLPRRWRTGSDVLFTKASGFDYAAATKVALASVYEHSVKADFVDGLAVDDIVLAGHGQQVWGAIKIVGIFDEPGSEYDRYLIHVKTFDFTPLSSSRQSPNEFGSATGLSETVE